MILLKDHVLKDVKQVVYALTVKLTVFICVCVEVIFGQFFRGFRPKRVAGHINYSDRAHCQIFVPKMELDEDVSAIVDWGENVLSCSLFEICTILLNSLKEEQKLMRL